MLLECWEMGCVPVAMHTEHGSSKTGFALQGGFETKPPSVPHIHSLPRAQALPSHNQADCCENGSETENPSRAGGRKAKEPIPKPRCCSATRDCCFLGLASILLTITVTSRPPPSILMRGREVPGSHRKMRVEWGRAWGPLGVTSHAFAGRK